MLWRGQAFFSHHIFVVLSDPRRDPERVVVVNVTSCKTGDDLARPDVVQQGEHPAIRQPSYVAFARAKVLPEALLEQGLPRATALEDFSPDLLARFCRAAANAIELADEVRAILQAQALV